ncbi:unnamed protein product [Amoebophrya sp. A25]|nr:unnamed protein product [Amoebophrya sp. A25]|eukprot:GSA25T00008183001.1
MPASASGKIMPDASGSKTTPGSGPTGSSGLFCYRVARAEDEASALRLWDECHHVFFMVNETTRTLRKSPLVWFFFLVCVLKKQLVVVTPDHERGPGDSAHLAGDGDLSIIYNSLISLLPGGCTTLLRPSADAFVSVINNAAGITGRTAYHAVAAAFSFLGQNLTIFTVFDLELLALYLFPASSLLHTNSSPGTTRLSTFLSAVVPVLKQVAASAFLVVRNVLLFVVSQHVLHLLAATLLYRLVFRPRLQQAFRQMDKQSVEEVLPADRGDKHVEKKTEMGEVPKQNKNSNIEEVQQTNRGEQELPVKQCKTVRIVLCERLNDDGTSSRVLVGLLRAEEESAESSSISIGRDIFPSRGPRNVEGALLPDEVHHGHQLFNSSNKTKTRSSAPTRTSSTTSACPSPKLWWSLWDCVVDPKLRGRHLVAPALVSCMEKQARAAGVARFTCTVLSTSVKKMCLRSGFRRKPNFLVDLLFFPFTVTGSAMSWSGSGEKHAHSGAQGRAEGPASIAGDVGHSLVPWDMWKPL